jgi:hypothetical protein
MAMATTAALAPAMMYIMGKPSSKGVNVTVGLFATVSMDGIAAPGNHNP